MATICEPPALGPKETKGGGKASSLLLRLGAVAFAVYASLFCVMFLHNTFRATLSDRGNTFQMWKRGCTNVYEQDGTALRDNRANPLALCSYYDTKVGEWFLVSFIDHLSGYSKAVEFVRVFAQRAMDMSFTTFVILSLLFIVAKLLALRG